MSADRPPGSFGATLREAREQRGISLRQIANATKISVGVLEALERNDISRLPGGIFGRAFVRSYAIEVGLNPEETIQQFIAQFSHNDSVTAGHPAADQIEDNEALDSDRRMASTFLRLIALSIPIAGVVVYFSAFGRDTPSADQAQVAVAAVAAQSTEAAAPSPDVSTPVPADPAPPAPVPAPVAPASTAVAPAGAAAQTSSDRLKIGLSTSAPCWVAATGDGKRVIERLMQPGERAEVEVQRELVITAGDAAAIALTINGVPARPLGKPGEVVTVRVNPGNYQSLLPAR